MELAYRWISRRPHSVWEIRQKLASRASEQEIDEVVTKLQALKLLDDFNFSTSFASYRLRERSLGPARIRNELRLRGVVKETIDRAIEAAMGETSEEEAASAAVAKFLRKRAQPAGPKESKRLYGFLYRSGFSPEVIRRALRRHGLDDIDWSLD